MTVRTSTGIDLEEKKAVAISGFVFYEYAIFWIGDPVLLINFFEEFVQPIYVCIFTIFNGWFKCIRNLRVKPAIVDPITNVG